MKHAASLLLAVAMLAPAAPISAVPGGEIGTLEQGRYTCELPGDATGPVGLHVPEADFTVISASSYRAKGTLGSYLLTGDRLVMTNGPHRGQKFHRLSRGFLRRLNADGSDGDLRCVLGRRRADSPDRCPDRPAPDTRSFQTPETQARVDDKQASCTAKGRGHERSFRQDRGQG
jgi:hypothetical protein